MDFAARDCFESLMIDSVARLQPRAVRELARRDTAFAFDLNLFKE
jgi:hypothetical protein